MPDDRFDDSGPAARYAIDLSPVTAEFRKGSFVITVSNPFLPNHNAAPTAGWGIVANRNRSRPGSYNGSETDHRGLLADLRTMLQLSAHPPVRESGSVVFDLDGRALGITTSVFPPGSNEASAVYALPFTHGIMRIVRDLTLGLEVEYGSLGTTATQAPLPEELRLRASHPYSTAARVISVQPGSAANLGDLTAGDDVLSVAGTPIRDHVDLLREVLLHGPWDGTPSGERLILRTVRNPKLVERTVRLNKRPSVSGGGIVATRDRYPVWRGIRVDYPTARREYLPTDGVRAIPLGVLVVSVDDDSSHSLKQGDLIRAVAGRPVGTPGQFHSAVRQQPDQPVQLELTDSRIAIVDPQAD